MKIKIKKTYHYYGYPEVRDCYEIDTECFSAKIEYYGNHGFDIPKVECKRRCNSYYWDLNSFMKDFYSNNSKIKKVMRELKVDQEKVFKFE